MSQSTAKQTFLLWFLAIFITLASVAYQRMTGPTHPVRGKVEIGEETLKYKLIRTHDVTGDAVIQIKTADSTIAGMLEWRRLNSDDRWATQLSSYEAEGLTFHVPVQPAAGKVMYKVTLMDMHGKEYPLTEEPVIIRFKGAVPIFVLLPHILFMFISMLLGTRCALDAVTKRDNAYRIALWTTGLLFIGGLILGPIVQKFAFDAYWTGWPFGGDLTDNKTALTFIFWVIALWRGKEKGKGAKWFVIAAVVQLAVYLIPHSMFGSELDYTNME
jgi:hypothetical protein